MVGDGGEGKSRKDFELNGKSGDRQGHGEELLVWIEGG